MQPLIDLFGIKDLIPHGYCLSWSPVLLWLHVISDLLITLAYYSIPLMLVYFIRQRKDLPYPWLVAMFAGFIVACGTTHLLSVITIWIPLYWLDGLLKAFTAIISIATAVLMLWIIPRALSLPSAAQLQAEIQQRKTAEEALRESENKLATILDSVEACIYIKDCNYQYQYANQPVRQLFGKALEDIIGKLDDAFFDETTTAKLRENDRRVIELGERIATEEINTGKDNTITRAYLSVKQPLRSEDGSIYGLCGISTDISERKQAERVLNQLKAMIDISLDGFWIVDLTGNLLQVNEAYAKISGYSIDELVNMPISQLEATEGPEQIKAHIAKVVAQGYDLFETRHRHKDGHIIDVEISVAFLPEFQQFCVFCRDITERKAMENELKASEAKFRSIIEVSPVPMALLNDEQLNIIFLNPAFVQTFGYNLDDIPTLADWWPKAYPDPDYRHWVEATWQMAMEKAKQEQTDIPPLEVVDSLQEQQH